MDAIPGPVHVKSPYTDIPHHECIKVVKVTINSQSDKPAATKVITKFLFLIWNA